MERGANRVVTSRNFDSFAGGGGGGEQERETEKRREVMKEEKVMKEGGRERGIQDFFFQRFTLLR